MNFSHHHTVKQLIIIGLILFFAPIAHAKLQWQMLAPGIEYTKVSRISNEVNGFIHAFKIDLNYNRLDLALAAEHSVAVATVKTLAEKNKALIAINGGFFTPQLQPIGLRIKGGTIKSKLKGTSWWGIFYIAENKANIVAQRDYGSPTRIEFAVQGGPRLITNGRVTSKLKSGNDERTALGITKDGKVILVVTEQAPLDTTTMANVMQAPELQDGFNCYNALNLDGGNSSQLYAQISNFNLNIPGYSFITDAVLVFARD